MWLLDSFVLEPHFSRTKKEKMRVQNLKCNQCHSLYPVEARYVCERCLGPLTVSYPNQTFDAPLLKQRILAGPQSLWRYADFLPVSQPHPQALPVGFTPLIRAKQLAEIFNVKDVWVKNDAVNPSYSFKDRVVSIALHCALELGFTDVACASTGNLANAVGALSSALGLNHHLLVPSSLEKQKLIASEIYGGLIRVDGNYDQINRLATQLADEYNWGFVNINLRPFYAEGSKTLAYEVAEQLGFRSPTKVIAPIGSGSLYTKIAKGFSEWQDLGLIEGELPAMYGAQPLGCSPVASAFQQGEDYCNPVKPDTIVTSLAIGNPADGANALAVARESGGAIEAIDDDEMRYGVRLLAQTTGIFTEAAGGVTTALLNRLARQGKLTSDDEIVIYITGNGLKTAETIIEGDISSPLIKANLESYQETLMAR